MYYPDLGTDKSGIHPVIHLGYIRITVFSFLPTFTLPAKSGC
jgi:hypothetical protein